MSASNYHIVYGGVGIVGGAYVKAFEKMGFKVTGIEANKKIIEELKVDRPMYHVDDDMNDIKDVDFIMLSINTPLKGKKLDLTYLFSSIKNVAVIVKNNPEAYVVLRSTVPPGTTRKYKNELEEIVGFPVKVLFQPEFLREKSCVQDALNPWHVVIGKEEDEDVSRIIELYKHFVDDDSITTMSVDEAEYLKLIHNSFNAAKISFFNQCWLLVNEINKKNGSDIDINVISKCITKTCEGLMNPSYGTRAGTGYYLSCLPKDSAEIAALEQEYGLEATLFKEVVHVNKIMVAQDKEEVLVGPHHMCFSVLKKIASDSSLHSN